MKNNLPPQAQLSRALEEIANCDFPNDWPDLLPSLKQSLSQNPQQSAVILETLATVFKEFEHHMRSNELLRSIKYCVDNFAAEHLAAFKQAGDALNSLPPGQQLNPPQLEEFSKHLRALHACCQIFYSLNAVDLPEQYEDAMENWFSGFRFFLNWVPPAGADAVKIVQLKSQICDNMTLYVHHYQVGAGGKKLYGVDRGRHYCCSLWKGSDGK